MKGRASLDQAPKMRVMECSDLISLKKVGKTPMAGRTVDTEIDSAQTLSKVELEYLGMKPCGTNCEATLNFGINS